jgi:disulfide bond formation protein DsbB
VSPAVARQLNAVFVLAMCAMLLGAYGVQFILRELPCPLCLLQRAGMLGVAVGGLLNVKFGVRPSHYGIALVSAMLGGAVSVRQVLLHIVPGTGSYGTAFFGLHLYTWALITFVAVGVVIAIMLLLDGQFDAEIVPPLGYPLHGLAQAAFTLAFVVAVANALTTFLMCGLRACPDNPTAYLRLR